MALVFGLGFLLQKPKPKDPTSETLVPVRSYEPRAAASSSQPSPSLEEETMKDVVHALEAGQLDEAESQLKAILSVHPQHKEALREIVTLYHTRKTNLLKALHYEEQLLAVETSRPHEFERYREIARDAKAQVRALRFLDGLKAASDDIAYMIPKTQGLILDDRNQYVNAIEKYREALSFASDKKGPIGELLGTDLMRIHNYPEAQSALEESLENFNEANRANAQEPMKIMSTGTLDFKLIDVYLNNGDYPKALAKTLILLKTDSQNPELQKFKEMAEMGIKGGK